MSQVTAPQPTGSEPGQPSSTRDGRAERFALAGAIASLTGIVLGMVRSKLVAMTVGSEGVGIVAETAQLVSLLNVAASVFGGAALLSWVSRAHNAGDRVTAERGAGTSALATVSIGVVGGIVACAIAPAVLPAEWAADARGYVALTAIAQVCTLLQSVVNHVSIGLGDLRATTYGSILSAVGATVISVALVLSFGLEGQFWSLVLGGALSLAVTIALLGRRAESRFRLRIRFDRDFARFAVSAGTVMLVSGYAQQILLSVARYSLETLGEGRTGTEYNGHFQAAWMIGSTYFGLLLSGTGNYFYPRFAASRDAVELSSEVDHAASMALRYAPALAIAAVAFRDVAVYVLYSGQFELAGEMLGYLLAGDIARAVTWAYLAPLPMRAQVKALVLVEGTNAAIGSVLFFTFSRVIGPLGAAVAFPLLTCVMCPITALVTRRFCGVTIKWRSIIEAILLCAVAVGVNVGVHVHYAARVIALAISVALLARSGVLRRVGERVMRR